MWECFSFVVVWDMALCQSLYDLGDLLLGAGILLYLLYAVFNVGAFLGLLTESLTV